MMAKTGHTAALNRPPEKPDATEVKIQLELKQREEFLAIAAHDLRSPLGLIQSTLSMILANENLSPLATELLQRAKRQSESAIRLVADLLDVMALEQGLLPRYEIISLHAFLKEFHDDYEISAAEQHLKFHYSNTHQDLEVLIDTDRIRQLLQNLFANAIKFTPAGKNIYLTVTPFVGRRRTDPPYPMAIVSLRDEGRGIPNSEMEKIFDKFKQLKDQSRPTGRGLGLSVAKQISQHHGGNIWVESTEHQGSTFHLLLPHVIGTHRAEPVSKKRILVVQDKKVEHQALHKEGSDRGIECWFAHDGPSAITLAEYLTPMTIVLDTNISKMTAAEVSQTLKRRPRTEKIPIHMLWDIPGRNPPDDIVRDSTITDLATFLREHFQRFGS